MRLENSTYSSYFYTQNLVNAVLKSNKRISTDTYRFGFNGKEKDNELKREGNSYDFGARIYDSRICIWPSTDPKLAKYAGFSPYNFCLDNPIISIDIDGKDIFIIVANNDTKKAEIQKVNAENIIAWMASSKMGNELIQKFINNPNEDVYITFGKVPNDASAVTTRYYDSKGKVINPKTETKDGKTVVSDNTDDNGNPELVEFKGTEIDENKTNYFITIDENEFETKNSGDLSQKKGAKILGHEFGAHLKKFVFDVFLGKKEAKILEHYLWGQETYGGYTRPGSSAEKFNNEVDKANTKSDKYKTVNQGNGKLKIQE